MQSLVLLTIFSKYVLNNTAGWIAFQTPSYSFQIPLKSRHKHAETAESVLSKEIMLQTVAKLAV